MSDEFEDYSDRLPDWDEGDDFEGELAEFDDFDLEYDKVNLRTAVMRKNNMIALLCIKTAAVGAAICRVDPREEYPAVQIYDDPNAAVEWFTKSLRTSRRNGWNVVYDGLPLQG
jgi:hypothetical protein